MAGGSGSQKRIVKVGTVYIYIYRGALYSLDSLSGRETFVERCFVR